MATRTNDLDQCSDPDDPIQHEPERMTHAAFTFPGQGSQHVGMGVDLYRNFAAARAVFEEVDEVLGQAAVTR